MFTDNDDHDKDTNDDRCQVIIAHHVIHWVKLVWQT